VPGTATIWTNSIGPLPPVRVWLTSNDRTSGAGRPTSWVIGWIWPSANCWKTSADAQTSHTCRPFSFTPAAWNSAPAGRRPPRSIFSSTAS
jgi:hypothetical protein